MTLKDVQEIHGAGLISEDQRERIVAHFKLNHPERNRFLTVLVALGGVLASTGVILVISSNWDAIPGWFKIFAGAALMCGAHFLGWRLRSLRQTHPKVGEALHFLGAGLFLANIALIGQVYNLSSRTPNALLFWLVGIVPLAWILRSVAVHVLSMIALFIWLGAELNATDGWFYFGNHASQFGIFAAVGLLIYGCGLALRKSSYSNFSEASEVFGLVAIHLGLWPLVVVRSTEPSSTPLFLMAAPALVGLGLIAAFTRGLDGLSKQWRNVWLVVLTGWITLSAAFCVSAFGSSPFDIFGHMTAGQGIASILLVAGCIMQMRVAEELRAPWMVNLAIITTGFCIIVTFGLLIGSMLNTGLVFLVGGAGILGLGFWLEKKRRAVIQRMSA
jgi:uncharacterized membrane protein